jgi:hypothetical protein
MEEIVQEAKDFLTKLWAAEFEADIEREKNHGNVRQSAPER